jgi:topoisomerase-4 subunit A
LQFEKDFGEIAIKGRQSMGNILTKNDVFKIALKQKGGSTLGGREVWFDPDVLRLNYDGRGECLGEFHAEDSILVMTKSGEYYMTNIDLSNHYEDNILRIEKFEEDKIWTAALFDAEQQNYPYLKRFPLEFSQRKLSFTGENPESRLILLSDTYYPRIEVSFGGDDSHREKLVLDCDEFIGTKSFKAKGKRITTYEVAEIKEIEPLRFPPPKEDDNNSEPEAVIVSESDESEEDNNPGKLIDEITGQMTLFD